MNVNSGGPHVLLFERDQQLATLLTSEFQLAGYDCHPARTAVEVFDAIARFPIRLVLVNLAQAAASRREFWVALDAQRRGRGVQVFTYRCVNIAGYGSDDSDETPRTVLTDMVVDGMLGVMNLVEAVRSRIPGSTTGSFSRISANPAANIQGTINPNRPMRQVEHAEAPASPQGMSQATAPFSTLSPNPALTAAPAPSPAPSRPIEPAATNRPGNPAPGFTDKIRAVIYPSSRSFSPVQETNWVPHNPQNLASTQRVAGGTDTAARPQGTQRSGEGDNPLLSREAGLQRRQSSGIASAQVKPGQNLQSQTTIASPTAPPQEEESGLAQLSRMIRESRTPDEGGVAGLDRQKRGRPTSPLVHQQAAQQTQSQVTQARGVEEDAIAHKAVSRQVRPVDTTTIGSLPLRASPIQDIPIEREQEYRSGQIGAQLPQPVDTASRASGTVSTPSVTSPSLITASPTGNTMPSSAAETDVENAEQEDIITEAGNENVGALAEQPRLNLRQALSRPSSAGVTSDDTLLNIVQSLPPMPSLPTPPQPPVLSGRATRSLGSVLLEGHLVPQHRLEVAQQIQRMLRGVDMNYQLGEILLMFKLLTPDQLLAASLVSYGLISTAQISALGRIRQELHSIGLEYDLESLLVLFRILSPEQLREVRASWSG